MRRICLASALGVLAVLASAPVALASSARLTPSGGAPFPNRSFVLTLPLGATPTTASARVTEDGQAVRALSVTPANSRFAVLLLIDASTSMRGEPIKGAMAAARALAAQRPAAQSLGVVTFNGTTNLLLRPTRDAEAITAPLANGPVLASGTHIYDAVGAAMRLVDPRQFDAAAVVVLSDGNDIGSTTSAERAAAAARAGHAHLFTIGLRSRSFDPATLRDLAGRGGGEFLGSATPSALAGIYKRLGDELANAYVVRYISTAPANATVSVKAQVGSQSATASYVAPRLSVPGAIAAGAASARSHKPGFLGTRRGAATVAFVVLLVVLLLMSTLLQSHARRVGLRDRVAQYGGEAVFPPAELDHSTPESEPALVERTSWGMRLAASLELARIDISPSRFVLLSFMGTIAAMLLCIAVTGSAIFAVLGLVAGPLGPRWVVRWRVAKQRRLFADQLSGAVQAIASAMRTGHSFVGAFSQYLEHAPEPTATEFRRLVADERLGVPLETALNRVVERMDNRDLRQVALVSVLQRETGGNGAEALDRVVGNIRARDDLRRLVRTLTAQGRMAQAVLSGLPLVTLLALRAIGGDQMNSLFHTGYGRALIVLAFLLVITGAAWIGRIVKIEV